VAKTAIISVDGHVKGSRRAYREYMPKKYLETYDEQVQEAEEAGTWDAGNLHPEFDPEVQWNSNLRIEKLESIGVVGEVLFANGRPFQVNRLDDFANAANAELGEVGRQVYNRWLVDFCAQAPERRRGQLAISFDDVDQAVDEVYWAKEQGLGGIALPGLTRGGRFYFDPELDPIWAACVETGLAVSQHGGGFDPNGPMGSVGVRASAPGFGAFMMISTENAFFSNRSLWMLIAGGVFDRFPDLRAAWVETQVHLIIPTITYLDKVCESDWMGRWSIKPEILRLPSEYFGTNVFIGLSPFSPRQDPTGDVLGKNADGQTLPGFHVGAGALMYGVDFPHFETCFQRNMGEVATLVETPVLTEAEARNILFDTAAQVYGFDVDALQPHIDRAGFEVSDVRARADEIRRELPEFNIDHITGGDGGFGRRPASAAPPPASSTKHGGT
jgi:predicted TIM-barrel fold metal-dependent hydrolase